MLIGTVSLCQLVTKQLYTINLGIRHFSNLATLRLQRFSKQRFLKSQRRTSSPWAANLVDSWLGGTGGRLFTIPRCPKRLREVRGRKASFDKFGVPAPSNNHPPPRRKVEQPPSSAPFIAIPLLTLPLAPILALLPPRNGLVPRLPFP